MLVEDAESGGELQPARAGEARDRRSPAPDGGRPNRPGRISPGTAFVECPLTLDYGAAEIFLDAIDTDLIPVKGTAIGDAIRTSVEAFEGSVAQESQGDHPDHRRRGPLGRRAQGGGRGQDWPACASSPSASAATKGSPIPAPGGGFRRDRRGEIILSRLDETTLQKIALNTSGRYVRSVTGDVDLEQIYSQGIKATLEDQELGSKRRQRWEERYQWILA